MSKLMRLPSGLLINPEHFRAAIKTSLDGECTILSAGCPPMPGSADDYDYLFWLADPINAAWYTAKAEKDKERGVIKH